MEDHRANAGVHAQRESILSVVDHSTALRCGNLAASKETFETLFVLVESSSVCRAVVNTNCITYTPLT